MPEGAWAIWLSGLGLLHGLALALFIAVAVAWGRHERRWRLLGSGVVTVLAITLVYVGTVRPRDIPVDWITILHHGLERKSIMHLYARGVHAGANFAFVTSAAAAGHLPRLYDVVWLNLWLALVNAAIFFHVALSVTGRVWALVWTLVFALNPAMFLAAFSELPTHLLALYFLAAVIAWAVLYDPLPQPRAIRGAAYALCALLTLFAALTRPEVALLGLTALGLHAAYALAGAERWAAAGQRLRDAGQRPLVFLSEHPGVVAVLCVAGWWFSKAGLIPGFIGRSEVAGLYPFNPSILSLYVFLPMLLLPIGASIAILFGFVYAIVQFRRLGGLALSLLFLVRAYFAAQYQYYEMGRYLSYVLPAVFLLGLFGKAEFDGVTRRRLSPAWCRAASLGYLIAWFTLPLPGIPEYYMRPEYRLDGGFAQILLDLNTQREVRYLLELTERNPECVFVGRVVQEHGYDPKVGTQYSYMVFGAPADYPVLVSEQEARLDDVIAKYAAGASCVRLYYGGDCNLNFSDRCEQFVAGRRRVDEYRFWSRPYNNPLQSGYAAPEVVLATYAWP